MNLDEVEQEIREYYQWWHEIAPGVTPLEEGRLGRLWAWFDDNVAA